MTAPAMSGGCLFYEGLKGGTQRAAPREQHPALIRAIGTTGGDDDALTVWDITTGLASLNMGAPVLHVCSPDSKQRGLAVMQDGSARWLGIRAGADADAPGGDKPAGDPAP